MREKQSTMRFAAVWAEDDKADEFMSADLRYLSELLLHGTHRGIMLGLQHPNVFIFF